MLRLCLCFVPVDCSAIARPHDRAFSPWRQTCPPTTDPSQAGAVRLPAVPSGLRVCSSEGLSRDTRVLGAATGSHALAPGRREGDLAKARLGRCLQQVPSPLARFTRQWAFAPVVGGARARGRDLGQVPTQSTTLSPVHVAWATSGFGWWDPVWPSQFCSLHTRR